jgi:hypothetical protein
MTSVTTPPHNETPRPGHTHMDLFVWHLDGFPVLVVVFAGLLALIFLAVVRPADVDHVCEPPPTAASEVATSLLKDTRRAWLKQSQNREYKRWGGMLLLVGFGGFVPSLVKLYVALIDIGTLLLGNSTRREVQVHQRPCLVRVT